ncbi:MAG: hypothetical protein PSN34_10955, partial [Urechidicola sp.]|nr:hypothetical protein [Urechidicola sp.]
MIFFIRHNMLIMSCIFVIIALFLYQLGSVDAVKLPYLILQGAVFLDDVLIYILALEILKLALSTRRIFTNLRYSQVDLSYDQTRLLALVSAFPFGLGVSSFLKGLSKDAINTKPISEGMTASMLIYPTTLASGFVFDSFGLSSLPTLFLFGVPIVISIFLISLKKPLLALTKSRLFLITTALGLCNYAYLLTLSQFIPHYFMLKQALFFIIISFVLNIRVVTGIPYALWRARNVFIFFACVGILGHACINWFDSLGLIVSYNWLSAYVSIAIPIFAIPLLSIFFIHPLVLFVVFSPLLSPHLINLGISDLSIYVIWIVMLINAQLLSPVSLTTVLSVSNSN